MRVEGRLVMSKRSVHGKFYKAYQVLKALDRRGLVVGVSRHYIDAIAAGFGWHDDEAAKFRDHCESHGWHIAEVG